MTAVAPDETSRADANGEDGFTLLETLVALTILSLSVAVLFGIFSQGLAWGRADTRAMQARVLAQALLARAAASPSQSQRQGRDGTGLRWQLRIAPYVAQDRQAAGVHPTTIIASVGWSQGEREQMLTLSTVVLGSPEASR